ncbi:MAG: LysM peptidoglycan-binding domain-containing protein [Solirubrobacteraceae bacterium]|nr:LysM peptidoglycan-binding domain-containing protein [Solirubrobacteraceae bacterium]
MRPASLLPCVLAAALLAAPAAASAGVPHTVAPGETLWSLAAAQNMTTRAFAAANGLSEDAHLVAGTTIRIPTVSEAAAALASAPAAVAQAAGQASATPQPAPPPMGGYTVRPGDTLSGLAAQAGVTVDAIAAMNGLDPDGFLIAGTVIKLPTGAPTPPAASAPAPEPVVPPAAPSPSPTRVTAADIATVAARNGVPADLSAAIAWQESGFNNAMVSSANARGVMQVMPGTWDWVQANLARRRLDPGSAIDNVGAGVLYLGHLLQQTGGDHAMAAAAYYQGLSSVRRIGMLPETQRYVANVMALRSRFGG